MSPGRLLPLHSSLLRGASAVLSRPAAPLSALRPTRIHQQRRTFLFSRSIMNPQDPVSTASGALATASPVPQTRAIQDAIPPPALASTPSPAPLPSTPATIASTAPSQQSLVDPSVENISPEFAQALDTVIVDASDLPAVATAAADPVTPALTAITQLGDLASLGLGGYGPVGLLQSFLELIYVSTGLPWWATIATCTVFLRLAILPFVVKAQRTSAAMQNLKPITAPIQAEMAAAKGDRAKQMPIVKRLQDTYKEAGVSPLGGLWGLVQMPVAVSAFFGLKSMAELPVPGFNTGGLLWFSDLTVMDPTYFLPIIASTTMLVVMENGMEMQASTNASQAATMKNVFRIMLLVSIFVTASMPAAVFVFWVTSNFLTLAQFFLFKNKAVRDLLGIPQLKTFANTVPNKGLSSGIAPDGMLAVKPMKFGEAWKMAREEAERRRVVVGKSAAIPGSFNAKMDFKKPNNRELLVDHDTINTANGEQVIRVKDVKIGEAVKQAILGMHKQITQLYEEFETTIATLL
ncbi:60Kd inner membrane protein-domain-containing protein [Chytriomyces sp. MP71]|nr:60Kd inner membrane protein-domain-containing protein [Chytriomyces sp. MP71]